MTILSNIKIVREDIPTGFVNRMARKVTITGHINGLEFGVSQMADHELLRDSDSDFDFVDRLAISEFKRFVSGCVEKEIQDHIKRSEDATQS